ncbi:Ig-like domain-containing protein [Enterobacter hormaechei]|uniref:Ig-like domain-containing protein n=1 Tax=Enterobacter hormaechei TaxID=158836 RepID=UPI001868D767|nr:Ig-like domain-containing protein [Enterobacter hormaechei]HBM7630702.1 Ig-like domain-containing protein [Enterobacter hormaechei subsp. steigerwaltii]
MSTAKVVDVIIRKTAEKTKLTGEGNLSVSISSPSVIEIQGSAQDVVRYVRQGNDLLIYMKDGSVIRCNNYFVEDTETHNHSELVFNDNQALTHISFADAGEASGVAATELTAQAAPISSIEPFLEQGSVLSDAPWGWIAGAALGGGAIGALLAHGGDGETKTKVIDNTKEVESATPTFLLTDNAGDKQGVLSAKAVTDDNTPTFSGTGQPGATIQVKDGSGSTIASTMVAKDGTWTVTLPTQADGEHTWSVVQIDGSKTTSAGSITVTVSTADTSVTLATTAGDNVINASEQAAGFTLSGTSKNLAQGTALTVTLNGKTYTAEVGANGAWSVKVPAVDAQALGDGTWTVNVSGKDAAGNTVSGSQTIGVDTASPVISVDTIAQDNIINAAEHNQPLTLTGKTDAEAGQIVTVTLNGKNHTATVGSDGSWSVTLPASEVQALANGEHTLTVNVSDKAGNGSSTTADFTVDTAAPVVTINTVAGDDILNTSEQGQAQIISGQANGAAEGDIVTVTVGGKTFTGAVQADGSWSVGVPASVIGALGEGSHSISVSVTDAAGNTGSATHGITLSGNPPEFTLDPISQDNVLNAQEAMQPLSLSGTSNLPNGSAVTVTLNNVNYQATVENGRWSVQVPVSDVLDLANTLYTVSVSGTDSVGNSGSAEANLLVDTVLPQVIVNTFAGDNLVNNAEAAVDQTLSGRVTGAAAGDTVSVTVGGKSYTATVGSDLKWSVTIPSADLQAFGDGDLTFSASVTNAHGNTGTGERDININAELPGLRVNTISGDDVINAIEQQQDLAVTGSSTHLAEGTQITVTINNVEYVTTVNASGNWQIGVPAADLQAWTAGGMTVSVSAEDAWGNTVAAEHPIELDLNAVAVTIDTVTTDDMLNAAEKGADVTLSGQTQGVEAGQTVVVKFADQTFTAQVQQDGSWHLTVPASAMETLIDGRAQVSVSVTNVNGNSADASRVVIVDTQPPAITLDNLTDDNIINAAEAQQDLVLSGSTTAEAGQTVTVTLNGKSYQTTVQADGRWQLNVPAADVGALTDGNVTVTATVSDVAGNSSSADRVGLVDATVPQVTINDFVTDTNTVNQLAHAQAQILSGSVTGAAAGDLVTITISNVDYTTVVDAAGNWSLGLPASVVQGLTDGTWTINVSVTDQSGNTGSSSVDVVVNTVTPVIGINTLAADDVINAAEKGEDLLLSGTSNQPEGTTITVNLNGINYTATTDASGNWSVTVPASAVSALGEANYTVTASVTDNVGNSAAATHDVLVDSSLPVVTLNNFAGDNIVNAAEVAAGQTLTGKVSNAASGDTVTIILGGQTYTATVQDDLTWSLPLTQSQLTALGNGDLTVSASVTNAHGNTGSSSLDVTIDAQLPGLRIDTVAGDDVINVIEHAQNLVISGTSTDLAAGSTVTVTINGKSYSASVLADGTWQAAVPAADVSRWADGSLTISASAQDTSGNPVNIGTVVDVDLAPVAININSVTDDNVLNAAEKGQDLVLSGSSSNVEAGQTVTIIFAGKTWTTTVDANGDWTCTVPAADLSGLKDGDASVQVSVTNVNGNAASSSQAFSVDTAAPAVTINTISGDNMLNAAEAAQDLTLSGTSTAEAGQTVTVTFNGNQYTAQVQANGSWTLDVPAADLAGIADGSAAVTVTVSDKAGNPASAGASVLVDTTVPQITFNIVAGDDIVNIAEHGQALIVTGKVTGAQAGDVITLTLNGKDYTAMLDGAGNWSVGVPAADVGALVNGDQTISATLTDKAGNSTSATHAFDVSLTTPVIAINTLAVDDVINATEKGQDLLISGTSNQPDGTRITVTLNGISYAATTDASGNWSVTVPAANVSVLGEASYSVTASVTDTAGNSANTSHSVLVDSALPQVTINAVATDDVINAAEVASGQTLSGKVSGAASGDTVTIGIGGNTYTATVQDDLSWSVNVASDVLTAIGNGDLTVTASVTNGHGNTGTGERDITIDASLPGLRVDTVAGDDVINSIEHGQNLIITGSSDGLASGSALTVTVNGKIYAATVLADGTWTAAIPAADVGALSAGTITVTVDGQSAAGNPVSISHDVKVDLAAVAISINPIASDDVINAAEKGADLVLSGSTTNVEENQTVTITFGGKLYTATVDASGNWTATVPSADLGGLKDGDASVQVSVTNVNGNSASAGREYSVDATAPTVSIEIVSDNNIINAAEAQQDLVINGVSNAEAGNTVTVSVGGHSYTATVQDNLTWSVSVPDSVLTALGNGDLTVTASVTNGAGNSGSGERDITIDANLPGLRVDTVAGDDVINSIEHGQNLIITGSSDGLTAGTALTVTVNGKTYPATVLADGTWSAAIPSADVSALAAGTVTVNVEGQSSAGNPVTINHDVTVDLANVAISIDAIASDDVINAAERGADLVLSGTTSNVEENQIVTITFGGKNYTATVDAEGKWTATVPSADLTGLKDGDASVQVSVTNVNGNSASAGREYSVDATAPSVTINTIATDDILNASEAQSDLAISGTSTAEAGQTVTVSLNGKDYTTTVSANGSWTLNVPAADLAGLTDGSVTVTAAVSDKAGNPASVDHTLTVDVTVPAVTIHTVAGDDVINVAEHNQAQIISGSATGAAAGDTVTVTIGDQTYTTVLDAAGNWSVGVPASVISGLSDGSVTVTASVTDAAGNTGSGTHNVTVDTGLPSVSFNAISDDNVLNAVEKGQDLSVSGTSANLAEGTVVTVTLNGKNYTATTAADGTWSLTVPAADLAGLGQASYTLNATATNGVGNSVSSSANLLVDTALPTVTINTVAGDNVINAAEVAAGQTLSGTVANAEAGNIVTVTIGGHSYTATVQNNLSWSVNVPSDVLTALGNGSLSVTATVTNGHGNTGTGEREIAIDANLPGLRVNTVAGDDVVNTIEHAQNLIVSGSSDGLAPGTALTVTVNGKDYAATVLADGTWSAAIPSTDVSAWPEGTVKISVTGDSAAGNPITISHDVTVDLATVAISINALATDDVINAAEKGADLVLSGVTTNVEAGQTVTISLNGRIYTTTVDDSGNWTYTVPSADLAGLKDGDASVQVSVTNVNGNSASAGREYSVDATAPSVTINTIATDDILNATEAQSDLAISGTSTAEAGQTLTVSLNGKDYTTTVSANGSWTLNVPAADLAGLTDGSVTVTASVSDKAGNPASVDHTLTVDVTVPAVTIHTVAGDDVINVAEHNQAQIISGSATGAAAGDTVTVTIGGQTYTTVLDAAGNWSVGVPANVISGLSDGSVTVTASVTDAAGNTGSGTHNVTVDTGLPSVSFNAISDDNVLNAVEKGQDLSVNGTSANLAEGTVVTVTLNGKNYTATTAADGTWSLTVPAADLSGLGEASYTLSATATNGVGNSISTTTNLLVDTALPTVTINTVAGDNVINAAEVAAGQTITGKVANADIGNTVTVNIGGNTYTATVQSDLTWSVNVPESVLTALGNGDLTVSATVTNDHGNTGTGERDITIDASLPGLRVDTVAGDDVINSIEHGQNLIVTGSSDGLAAGTTLTVTVNGKTYAASVLADGTWSAAIPAADVGALAAGTVTVTVAGQSAAGNPVSISHDVTVDLAAVAISIDAIATDDVINAAEKGADLVLSGSTSNVEENQTVTITFGGKSYTAKVDADGNWTATVPSSDLAGLKDGDASVQVSVTNVNGNSASAGREYSVDATAPTVTIDTVAGDNVINGSEAAAGVAISGTTTAEVGQTVTVNLGGNSYTAQVQQGGVWSINVPAADLSTLADNGYTVQVSVSDAAGNPGSAGKAITLDTTPPTVSFNVVAGDDVINSVEHGQAQVVSGTATGASVGDKLVITIGSNQYTTTVDASGKWSVGVPASDISALTDGTVTLSATITDSAGNSSTQTHDVVVNTASVALTVNTLSGDDVINAAEAGASLVINGSSAQFANGTQVTITLNGKSYTATIQSDGSWTTTVPAADVGTLADGASYQVSVSAQDSAGNSASATHTISVDTTAPVISVNTLSGDDVLNAAEAQQPLTVHGSSSAEACQTVTVTLGGKTYTALVANDGTWTLDVPAADLANLSEGALTVTASVNDKAGNNGQTTHTLTVDTVAPAVTISTVADDDIVNNAEQLAGQTISGTTTAEQGQTVTVSFNGHSYQVTVAANGSWSVFVPGRDFLGLSDGDYTITATVSDKAGNPGSATHDVTLNGDVPTIAINTFAQDDIVNAAEHGTPLVISGTTDAPTGQTVTITLNGKTYTATVQNDGTWSYTVGSADVTALADGGSYVINAQVSNAIGNSASDNHTVTVDLTAPSMGISIDSLQNDTGLSANDFLTNDSQVVVNGSLTAQLGNNEKAQISLDGGTTWIDLTVTGTTWRCTDGRTLTDGTYQYQVRVIDNAGNVGATDSQDVVIDLTKPAAATITVDSVSQDTGLSDSDFITSDNQISLKGTLGAALGSGDHAQISLDGGATWTDVSVSGLSWTYVDGRTLADGDYNYQLRVIDDAGNISATTSQVVTIDTVAPDASKTIAIDSISDDTGLSSSDFITNDTSLTLHGSLGATLADGEYAQISIDGGVTWQNVIVTGNSWYYVDGRTLGNQTYDYYVRVVDAAGNVGASAHQQVTVDTVAPDAAITVTVDNITVDTGFDNNDFLTSSTSYTLNGTLGAELGAGEYVQVSMDGGTTWVYATVSGTRWSYNDTRTLADGDYRYQVRVVDQAGNVGATTTQDVTVDTQAPQYGITIDSISEDTGQSGSDFITMDTSLTINGSLGSALASDERVQISLDGGNTWIDTTVTNQRWSYTDTRDLADGDYTYQVRIIDQAGNVGSTSSQVVTVDTTPPDTVGTVVSYTDGEGERTGTYGASVATDDTSPLINGTLNRAPEDGEIVQLYRDGILLGQVTMNGSASWSYQDNGLLDGNHTYILRVTDKAGNYTESDGFVLNVDTSIPTTTAAITAQTTSDTTPIVSGTVSADLVNGEYLVVTVNGKTYTSQTGGAVVVDPDHNTWYLQIPDSDALSVASYDVTAQVKSSAGNGNTTGTATGSLVIDTTSVNTDWATTAGNSNNSTMTLGMNSSGLWNIIANGQSYSSSDDSTYAGNTLTNTRSYYVVSQTAADFDRNGTQDIFATENTYAGSTQVMWTYDGSSYTASQLAMGTTIWYGGVIAYDKTGDGYLDLAYGDAGMDSLTYLVNTNGVLSPDGTGGEGGFYGQFDSGREISGVDLNNDGTVDIVQHTNRSGAYSLTVINNNGNGTLSIGQNLTNVFVANASNTTTAASMTWADFNGDGYMDLYLGSSYNNNGGVIYYNDGTGQLSTTKSAVEASNATAGYLSVAVDWNGDGQMDIIKLSTYGSSQTATLFTNNGYGSTWTSSQLASGLANVTGVAAVDYNWDGAQDLLVSQQNGKVVLVQNNAEIADGTAMHLHIVDSEGINAYYGNTVNLYNAAGVLVASQIINAQSGIGSNDTSALVSFYGLDPNETYSAEIVKITNGVSDNVTWTGLDAGNGKEGYVLTAEAATGGHSGTITGTGYNDTFIAEDGTYTYNGSGGWNTHSDYDTWSNTGGMDVVDYRNATSGITVDLRLSTAQDTGFGTTRLLNIEGINGSDYDDVITGNSGDNQFEGRGGNDTFNIGSGGHDTLLYKLINASDATGGNGSDVVNGFTVGTWEGTADTDRIDLRDLLSDSGYTGTGSASYVNGVATLDSSAGSIADYIRVVQNGSNTEIQVDLDGTGGQFTPTTLVTLNGVQTDLATLLANHQLLIA